MVRTRASSRLVVSIRRVFRVYGFLESLAVGPRTRSIRCSRTNQVLPRQLVRPLRPLGRRLPRDPTNDEHARVLFMNFVRSCPVEVLPLEERGVSHSVVARCAHSGLATLLWLQIFLLFEFNP